MTYSDRHNEFMTATPPEDIRNSLGEAVATRLETVARSRNRKVSPCDLFPQRWAEQPFDGEDRILVPSPKVATYDLQPEMSAPRWVRGVCEALSSGVYDMAVVNFANPTWSGTLAIFMRQSRPSSPSTSV